MLTLSSPPREKFPCFIFFRQSGQQYKISWRGEKARFLEQNFVAVVVKTSLMKADFISHRLTFFLFLERIVHLIYFSVNFVVSVVLNYHTLVSE